MAKRRKRAQHQPKHGDRHHAPRHGRRGAKKGKEGVGDLYDPESSLSGRKLKKAVNALTRLELEPALHGYQREADTLASQMRGQQAGLEQLGQRTGAAVAGAYSSLKGDSAKTQATQAAIANMLTQNTSNIANQTQAAMTKSQTGELGDLTASLKSQNVESGGSAAQQALAQQVQAQQQAAAQSAQGYQNYAAQQGATFQQQAAAQGQAEQMRGTEAQSSIHQAVLDRIAASNADYSADIREAMGKAADTQALYGASRLKNLLQLRGDEREHNASLAEQNLNARSLGVKAGYNKAIVRQAKIGLKGRKVTGRAGVRIAKINARPNVSRSTQTVTTHNKPPKRKRKR